MFPTQHIQTTNVLYNNRVDKYEELNSQLTLLNTKLEKVVNYLLILTQTYHITLDDGTVVEFKLD